MQLKHPSQQLLFGEFKLGRLLGTGTFSRVYAARSILTQYDVAVKVVVKEEVPKQFLRFILRECELVQVLDHDNIVPAYEVMEDEHNLYIVMKLARDGDLLDYVNLRRRLPEDEGRIIFKQLLDAVEYAHSKRIIHRDIKLENILLDRGRVLLADWGFGSYFQPGIPSLRDPIGSLNYCAPEVIRGDAYIGPEVDCWSLGVCLFAILAGRLPFQHLDDECKRKQIRSGEYSIPAFISPEARDLLQRILVVNSSQRMTIPEMRQHNWLRSCSQPSGA